MGRKELFTAPSAFTLTELLVIIGTIALLAVVFLPALAASNGERASRTACLNNLRQIGIVATVYAGDHLDYVFPCRTQSGGTYVQISFNQRPWLAFIGVVTNGPNSFWTCPNRPGFPMYDNGNVQYFIGYQYFGWSSAPGTQPYWILGDVGVQCNAYSPVKLSTSKPWWTVAADANIKIAPAWGTTTGAPPGAPNAYQNMPPHPLGNTLKPAGGNQVFVDGSAQWFPYVRMFCLHSWRYSDRFCFWYQDFSEVAGLTDPLSQTLRKNLSHLQAKNYP
jgi:type II secretory pathway pseudopilin PulG